MAITVTRVTVLNSAATQLTTVAVANTKRIIITNGGPNPIFLATTNAVTTANGAIIPAGQQMILEAQRNTLLWAIAGTADQVAPANTSVLFDAAD